MSKCVVCGKESGKGKTCGSTCRSRLARSVANEYLEGVAFATVEQGVAAVQDDSYTREYVNELGLTVKVLPNGLREVYDPNGSLARTEADNGQPVSYDRPLMPCEVRL